MPCLLVLFCVGDMEVLTELREGQVMGLLGTFITGSICLDNVDLRSLILCLASWKKKRPAPLERNRLNSDIIEAVKECAL